MSRLRQNSLTILFLSSLSLFLAGCSSGEQRYNLSGTVTYKGKPVASGYIMFEPDTTKGNKGGPGRANIVDGKYDTSAADSVGVLGGPHIIHLTGFDKSLTGATAGEVALPKSLFTDHTVSDDLPKKDGTKDFAIK